MSHSLGLIWDLAGLWGHADEEACVRTRRASAASEHARCFAAGPGLHTLGGWSESASERGDPLPARRSHTSARAGLLRGAAAHTALAVWDVAGAFRASARGPRKRACPSALDGPPRKQSHNSVSTGLDEYTRALEYADEWCAVCNDAKALRNVDALLAGHGEVCGMCEGASTEVGEGWAATASEPGGVEVEPSPPEAEPPADLMYTDAELGVTCWAYPEGARGTLLAHAASTRRPARAPLPVPAHIPLARGPALAFRRAAKEWVVLWGRARDGAVADESRPLHDARYKVFQAKKYGKDKAHLFASLCLQELSQKNAA